MKTRELLEETLTRQVNWITAADSRVGLILPMSTAMLSVLAALSTDVNDWTTHQCISSTISILLLIGAIICAGITSFPRTSGPQGSVIYFGGIASRDPKRYLEVIKSLTEDSLIEDLSDQCHRNAKIAVHKFVWIRRGMIALLAATIPWLTSVYLLYTT